MDDSGQLLVIGDRVLIAPDTNKERTTSGLYLPQGVVSKENVQTGYIIKVGPGYALPQPPEGGDLWGTGTNEPRYVPLQVKEGDFALFLRRESVEIEYDGKKYLIVPQAAILAVVRDGLPLS